MSVADRRHRRRGAPVLALLCAVGIPAAARSADIVVGTHGTVPTITAALARARAGDRILIEAGVYREPTLIVRTPVTIEGEPGAILDGEGERQIMIVAAPRVTVRGLDFRNVGVSFMQDRAALRVVRVWGCTIERNRFEHTFFAIYLAGSSYCLVRGNDIVGDGRSQTVSGNGIHLWYASHVTIEGNHVRRQRDGIYFEFTTHADVRGNLSEDNQRYGLHFMFSDSCQYRQNTFRHNVAGVAVMYSNHVSMLGNRFLRNWGSAAYGLLLKEIRDSELRGNRFEENSVGLDVEGAARLDVSRNTFRGNGWAVKLISDATDNHLTGNNFIGNAFDVATSSRQDYNSFVGNYWDAYHGYDLNHDGRGDVPFHPVRLFSVLVAHNPPVLILLRSPVVALFDAAERAFPALTPESVVDPVPLMHPVS